jgi:hypothetical protein
VALAPGITVERQIARGGMGIVTLRRDTRLDRPLAIKGSFSTLDAGLTGAG